MNRSVVGVVACALALALSNASAGAQDIQYQSGQNLVPVFEGWQRNEDGSYKFFFGYLNRNYGDQLDIPVGPNNRFEPGPADRNQPTHFYTRRHEFVFSVSVPRDWDKTRRLQWIVTVNGKTETANGWLQPEWEVDDGVIQMNLGGGGAPPTNPPNQHPKVTSGSKDMTAGINNPLTLSVQASDDGIPRPRKPRPGATTPPAAQGLRVRWFHYRGAGKVTFTPESSTPVHGKPIDEKTQAVFASPGSYIVRAVLFDGLLETPYDITVTVK
ncbi:MAG: hypothetical protein FJW27_16090 [Acidimicrobiia bacterium]|nr:hypothetical protein [Acidimicrobiia bacterium]